MNAHSKRFPSLCWRRHSQRLAPDRPLSEVLEGRLLLATHTWTGAASNLWSNNGNWIGGSPAGNPQAVLFFPNAANLANANDLTGLTVSSIDFAGGGYVLGGNAITLVQGPTGAPRIHMDAAATRNTVAIRLGRAATNIGITVDVVGESTLIVTGIISGGAAATTIIKEGSGELVLSAANTFADGVLINAGVLNIRNGLALGTTSTGQTNRTTVNGGTLELEGSLFVTESFFQGAAGGTLRNVSGNSTWSGEVFLASTDLNAQVDPGGSLTISGKIFDNTAGPMLGVTKTGFGRLILTAANTYRGATTINGGRLTINNASALGTADAGTTVRFPGALDLQGFITVVAEPLVVDNGFLNNVSGNNVWRGPVTLVNSPLFDVKAGTLTIAGVIGGSTELRVLCDFPGKLILTNTNTYTGPTSVFSGGILNIQQPLALGQAGGPSVSVGDGGALELELTGANTINEGLSLVGGAGGNGVLRNISGTNTWTGPVLLNSSSPAIGVSGGQLTISGSITQPATGSFGMTKVGDGALFLTANNTYRGLTNVNAGSLFVNGSLSNSTAVVNGGRLGGTGSVTGINAVGGVVNPGVGVGRLTTFQTIDNAGNATFGAGAVFEVDLNGTTAGTSYDQLTVFNGGLRITLGGSILSACLNFSPLTSASFRVIDNIGPASINGTFVGLPEGATISTSRGDLRITYKGGDGNDVVLTHAGSGFNINTPSRLPDRSVTPLIDEGRIVILNGTISDPDPGDAFFLEINWGDGTPVEKREFRGANGRRLKLTHRYHDDNPSGTPKDKYTIRLAWRDKAGEGNSATLTTTVRNVAPVLNAVSPVLLPPSGMLSQLVSFIDRGSRDKWTAMVDFGDGSGTQAVDVREGKKLLLKHRYTKPGAYVVHVTVRDDDGGVGRTSFAVRR